MRHNLTLILAGAALALLPGAAPAAPGVSLLPAVQSGLPGTEVFFRGVLGSPDDTYSLDGLSVDIAPLRFTPDYADFLNNYPATVDPATPYGTSAAPVELFGLTVLPGTPAGLYTGSLTLSGMDTPATGPATPYTTAPVFFQVRVPAVAVPEPSALALCGLGLLPLMWWARRRWA